MTQAAVEAPVVVESPLAAAKKENGQMISARFLQ